MFFWENKNKRMSFLHIILLIKNSLKQWIHFNGNIFGNKWCRYIEGSLYKTDKIPLTRPASFGQSSLMQ